MDALGRRAASLVFDRCKREQNNSNFELQWRLLVSAFLKSPLAPLNTLPLIFHSALPVPVMGHRKVLGHQIAQSRSKGFALPGCANVVPFWTPEWISPTQHHKRKTEVQRKVHSGIVYVLEAPWRYDACIRVTKNRALISGPKIAAQKTT